MKHGENIGTQTEAWSFSLTLAQLESVKIGKTVGAGKSWPETEAGDHDLYFCNAKELEWTLMLITSLNMV